MEVTDGVVRQGIEQVLDKLNTLRDLGVTSCHRRLLDRLSKPESSVAVSTPSTKGRSIIHTRAAGCPTNELIAKAIIQIGYSLELNMLAERIETREEENTSKPLAVMQDKVI